MERAAPGLLFLARPLPEQVTIHLLSRAKTGAESPVRQDAGRVSCYQKRNQGSRWGVNPPGPPLAGALGFEPRSRAPEAPSLSKLAYAPSRDGATAGLADMRVWGPLTASVSAEAGEIAKNGEWTLGDLNPRPRPCEGRDLPTDLSAQKLGFPPRGQPTNEAPLFDSCGPRSSLSLHRRCGSGGPTTNDAPILGAAGRSLTGAGLSGGRSAATGRTPGTLSTPRPHERPWSTVRLLASAPDPVPVARHARRSSDRACFAPRTTRDEVSLSVPGSRPPWGRRPEVSARA